MDAPVDSRPTLLTRLQQMDEARPSLPAEHWVVLGLGAWMLLRRRDSVLGRLASMALGGAMVWRAMSGRDGIAKKLRADPTAFQPTQPGEPFHDVAAPWPYEERTRVSEPHVLP